MFREAKTIASVCVLSPSSLHLQENLDALDTSFSSMQEHLGVVTQELWDYLESDTDWLRQELNKDLEEVKKIVQPFLNRVQNKWEEEVEFYHQKVAPVGAELRASAHQGIKALQEKLGPLGEDTRDRLRVHADWLRTQLAPHGDKIRERLAQRLTEIKNHPSFAAYHTKTSEHLQTLREKAKHALDDMHQSLSSFMETVKAQVTSLVSEVNKKLNAQ